MGKLGAPVKNQFKKKLAERLENPHVPADKLSGYGAVYKIKLRAAGYRLVYEIVDDELFVYVLAIGKRDKDKVYATLKRRM
ncbi:type II toxin-antitoxin system RelE family toxin [Vreelandella sp. EE22]